MPQGISKNPLTDISKVYLDQVSEARLKSLEKASVLDTSDNPDDQDEARRIRVMHDYADLKKQQKKARKKAVAEENCDCDCGEVPCVTCGEDHHKVDEGFSDWRTDLREIVGSASPSTMTGPDKVSQEPGKSLHTTSDRNAQKVTEKKVKNKIKINPEFKEAVEAIGGQLLEVKEVIDPEPEVDGDPVDDKKAEQQKKKEQQLKKRIIRMKMMAVNSGNDQGIVASYDPLEAAVEYFFEEGINEEGLEQLIEDIGLDDFVDFIDGGTVELNEERKARRATVRAKKYDVVKKEVDKADAARKASKKGEYAPSYAKKETDVTVYDDDKPAAKKKAVAKKPVAKKAAPKPAPKKAAPKPVAVKKPVTKKVVKAVAKVKKTQPAKKTTKQGLGDKIRTAYKKGMERHKKAREAGRVPEKRAKEFGKGVASGVKTAVKFAKDVKKVVSEEELLEKDLNAAERRALPDKDFVFPGKGEGPKGKQRGAYPIPDKKHARNALAMAAAHASPEKQAKVKAAVKKKFPGIQVSESRDKALDIVRQRIIKKHGEGAIYDPKRDKPTEADKKKAAAERKKRDADKAKAFADRAKKAGYKSTQDYANVVARYGSEDNMRKGKGLGS